MPMVRLLGAAVVAAALVAAPAAIAAQDGQLPPEALGVAVPGGDLPGEVAVQLVKVVAGLSDPVNVTHAGDGSGRLFVVERVGRIRIVRDGRLLEEPFLDITDAVDRTNLEQGLLGLAFDPNYASNGYFYVYFTDFQRNGAVRLVRYRVSADDPDKADPRSDYVLFTQEKPYRIHNGGEVQFGPDGYLYVALGDGGDAIDPDGSDWEWPTPSLGNLLGKLLRLDVHGGEEPYGIPPDNPFAFAPDARPETWAYGLRNPWQFAFDRANGDLYIGDVGAGTYEEINVQTGFSAGGQHYGWNWMEGTACSPHYEDACPPQPVGVLPVAEYTHAEGGCAVVAIGVYRGAAFPALDGVFFNSDFCSGKVWGLARDEAGAWAYQELLDTDLRATGGGEDEAGELYLTSCACTFGRDYDPFADPRGAVWRVVPADQVPAGAEVAPLQAPEAAPEPEELATPAGPAAPVATEAAPPPAETATIEARDVYFEPAAATVRAAADVRLTLANTGAVDHNFSVDALGVDVDLPPGASEEITVNVPAGEYEFYCDVPGHKDAGMVGTLTAR